MIFKTVSGSLGRAGGPARFDTIACGIVGISQGPQRREFTRRVVGVFHVVGIGISHTGSAVGNVIADRHRTDAMLNVGHALSFSSVSATSSFRILHTTRT